MGSADIVRLPDGRTVTKGRALAAGWIDAEGNLTDRAPKSYSDVMAQQKAQRAADWRKRQGLDAPDPNNPNADPAEVAASAVLTGKPKRQPKPLVPRNVDHDGQEITDKETLDEIARKTAEIEAKAAQE